MSERLSYDEIAEIVDAHTDALPLFARQWPGRPPRMSFRKPFWNRSTASGQETGPIALCRGCFAPSATS